MAKTTISIYGDVGDLKRSIAQGEQSLNSLNNTANRAMKGIKTAAVGALGAAGVYGAVNLAKDAFAEYEEAVKTSKQTEAVLKSTGNAAKTSATEVAKLAEKLSFKAGIDDEVVQSGSNVLLMFTKIRNETGKGNKIFDRATAAALDMSVAFKKSVPAAATQLAKALNDPIKGTAALSKVGVKFTDQQKEQIKTLVESGKTLKAQKIILKEVEERTKGSAAAQATATGKATVAIDNMKEALGTKLAPVVERAANKIAELARQMVEGRGAGAKITATFRSLSDAAKTVAGWVKSVANRFFSGKDAGEKLGKTLAVLVGGFTALKIITGVITMVKNLKTAFGLLNDVMKKNPVLFIAGALILLVTNFDLVKGAIKKVVKAVDDWMDKHKTLTKIIVGFLLVTQPMIGLAILVVKNFGTIKKVASDLADTIGGALSDAFSTLGDAISDIFGFGKDIGKAIFDGIKFFIVKIPSEIIKAVKQGASKAIDAVKSIPKAVGDKVGGAAGDVADFLNPFAAGGRVDRPQVAIVGEGKSHEYVIPTEPQYRDRARKLLVAAARDNGFQMLANGGVVGKINSRLGKIANRIDAAKTRYDQSARLFDLSDEELINEGTDTTPPSINQKMMKRRLDEIAELYKQRKHIFSMQKTQIKTIQQMQKVLAAARSRVAAIKKSVVDSKPKGQKAKDRRSARLEKLNEKLNAYAELGGALPSQLAAARNEFIDTGIDLQQLNKERNAVKGTELPEWEATETEGTASEETATETGTSTTDSETSTGSDTTSDGGKAETERADLEAQLNQKTLEVAALNKSNAVAEAYVKLMGGSGDIGAGAAAGSQGVNVTINSLVASDKSTVDKLQTALADALAATTSRRHVRASVGL